MQMDDRRLSLILLLTKMNILGMRKVSFSLSSLMIGRSSYKPPLCAIELAMIGHSKDFIEFVVKNNHPGEEWLELGRIS